MGRTYTYHCDACGKPFGYKTHLNVKSLRLAQSRVIHAESDNPKKTEWRQVPVITTGSSYHGGEQELHFCDTACMKEFMDRRMPKEPMFGGKTEGLPKIKVDLSRDELHKHLCSNGECKLRKVGHTGMEFQLQEQEVTRGRDVDQEGRLVE